MDFSEHKELREFDLNMLEKRFKKKIEFAKEIQKMKLSILKAAEDFNDKRHAQIKRAAKELAGFELVKPIVESTILRQPNLGYNRIKQKPLQQGFPREQFIEILDKNPVKLREGAMRLLKAVAMFHPKMISRFQMGTISGLAAKTSTFSTYISELKRCGWLFEQDGLVGITQEGIKNAGEVPDLPTNPQELVEMWAKKFRDGAARILKILAEIYPNEISREELGEKSNILHNTPTFSTYVSELRRNGLIETKGNMAKASKELFLED